jgi:uncharacterized membrane protein
MSHEHQLDLIAMTLLVSVVVVFVIELLVELSPKFCRLKWSLGWYTARYLGIACAILLAVNVLTD